MEGVVCARVTSHCERQLDTGKVAIREIKGAHNPANFLTKAVGGAAFARDRAYSLGMR